MTRRIELAVGEFYHIYNRGTDKRDIFLSDPDKERFTKLLYLCNGTAPIVIRDIPIDRIYVYDRRESIVDIGAYCLMPNHFHLLVRERIEGGISTFMRKLSIAHSMYFNKKHGRTGALFESRFKSQHVDNDEYLKYLFSYIHLNPVKLIDKNWKENGVSDKEKAKNFLKNDHKYSSYIDYLNIDREEKKILSTDAFPQYFTEVDFEEYIDSWLNYKDLYEKDKYIEA